jgi:hypothetical protein
MFVRWPIMAVVSAHLVFFAALVLLRVLFSKKVCLLINILYICSSGWSPFGVCLQLYKSLKISVTR